MGFLDLEFLSSRASFFTAFLNNCGRGENLGTITCHKTDDVGKDMLLVKYVFSNNASFCFY